MDEIQFVATLARTSAVTIAGEDGDAKVRMEVPASELAEIMKLVAYGRDTALEVTIRRAHDSASEA
jgi:hypothetical protein